MGFIKRLGEKPNLFYFQKGIKWYIMEIGWHFIVNEGEFFDYSWKPEKNSI